MNVENTWLLPASFGLIIPKKRKTAAAKTKSIKRHTCNTPFHGLRIAKYEEFAPPQRYRLHINSTLASQKTELWVQEKIRCENCNTFVVYLLQNSQQKKITEALREQNI